MASAIPGRLAVDHRAGRFWCDVARGNAGAAGGEHDRSGLGQLRDRGGDLLGLVRHDSPLDLVAVAREQLGKDVAARILARAGNDAVRDGQHGCFHTAAFVFSTRVTSAITISLSIAFAMS